MVTAAARVAGAGMGDSGGDGCSNNNNDKCADVGGREGGREGGRRGGGKIIIDTLSAHAAIEKEDVRDGATGRAEMEWAKF